MKNVTGFITLLVFLLLGAVLLALASCTKEVDQCGMAYQVRDFKTLKGKVTLAVDTTWTSGSVVCGEQFKDYKIEEQRDINTQFTSYCPNGETLYYYRFRIITK